MYTEPEHRGKGAAPALMHLLMNDFNADPGQALLCGTGSESAVRIYAKYGFVAIDPARTRGRVRCGATCRERPRAKCNC